VLARRARARGNRTFLTFPGLTRPGGPDIGCAEADASAKEVKACVVLAPGQALSPEALLGFCQTRMPHFAVPRYVEFLDTLPKTPTAKVQKGDAAPERDQLRHLGPRGRRLPRTTLNELGSTVPNRGTRAAGQSRARSPSVRFGAQVHWHRPCSARLSVV
jgi:hypothetical protein